MGGFRVLKNCHGQRLLGRYPRVSNTRELGKLLYVQYLYPLEVAAALLLVAMIAAIALNVARAQGQQNDQVG
jgi:NADH-quinone oxidoreductase subunit J